MGKSYVIDHCINFLNKSEEDTALKVYITDALKAVVENTSKLAGGVTMRRRFYDLINDVPEEEGSEEKAEEIKNRMKEKLERLGKEGAQNG
jgi:uncharacterized membrane-anchored protein YjiN (DUF445 family)